MKNALLFCLLLALATGCRTQNLPYPRSLTHPTGEYPSVGNLEAVNWVVCTNETDAELVLVLDITIPEVLNDKRELPIRRVFTFGADGSRNGEGSRIAMNFNSDGVSRDGRRGIGRGRSYSFESSDGLSMSLAFTCYWTADDGTQGKLDAHIPCLVGIPDEWALSETARLKVSYRPPRRESESAASTLTK